MSENICSVCNEEFEDKYFDLKQMKCILHCEKNDWYVVTNEKKNWNKSSKEILFFWELIHKLLDCFYSNESKKITFYKIVFPPHEKDSIYKHESNEDGIFIHDNIIDMGTNFYSFIYEENNINKVFDDSYNYFTECKFLDILDLSKYEMNNAIVFCNCNFYNTILTKEVIHCHFKFDECNFNNSILGFSGKVFNKSFTLINSINIFSFKVINSTFKKKFSLFNSNIEYSYFQNSKFNSDAIFDETYFKENVDFKYTNFAGISYFQNMKLNKKINLEKATFQNQKNFLGISNTNSGDLVENRETARIIKDSFEQQNNIIEANKFYALEMKEREKELTWKDDFLDKLVFTFHGIASNHSQNWVLPLFWIIIIGMLVSCFEFNFLTSNELKKLLLSSAFFSGFAKEFTIAIVVVSITSCFLFTLIKQNRLMVFFIVLQISIGIYIYHTNDALFKLVAKTINPFSVMKNSEDINLIQLFSKITIAYLIYQLIISIRQNTRRK